MAESTLGIAYADLRSEIGYYLGFGTDSSAWDTAQTLQINNALKSGLRKFYYPAMPSGDTHNWRFMRPITTLSVTAADYDYDLPATFGGIEGNLTFALTDTMTGPIKQVDESDIRRLREASSSSGTPRFFAIRPKAGTPTGTTDGQRWELILWPTPSTACTLTYRYVILPDVITSSQTYSYGGAQHAETVKACVLAAAEETLNDGKTIWKTIMMERLMASIKADKAVAVQFRGYNGDNSDSREGGNGCYSRGNPNCTYNGVQYD